jgi:aerobic carbon-monoxide dehydrogenase small subunit
MIIKFKLNGKKTALEVSGSERLIDVLRERLDLVGTKEGCGKGECGACTVLLNNDPVCSCLVLSAQVQGKEVVTIEGIENNLKYKPVQDAFEETGAVQCGFCSPGMVLSAAALLIKKQNPSRAEIKRALSGNLCRCTGYEKIFDAVEMASDSMAKKSK